MSEIAHLTAEHPQWLSLVEHLETHNMARWVMDSKGALSKNVYCLAAIVANVVIGHITLKKQLLVSPATSWSDNLETPLLSPTGKSLYETYVQTFAVDPLHRRQGYGSDLQLAALELTQELGCYQMRSWSSTDKPENYALKLKLGFAAHPAILTLADGRQISGVYFVKTV